MAKIFSNEDGNLSSSIRVTRERQYSDIDLSFSARTTTDGDVFKKTDAAAVKQAVKNLLQANRNSKPYTPGYGGNLGSLLFELADGNTGQEIIEQIENAIERWEPRAKVINIKVVATPDYNQVSAIVEFRIINTTIIDSLKVNLTSSASVADIPVELPVTAPPVFTNILRTEAVLEDSDGYRLLTQGGLLLAIDSA